jgi:hypothetical protein
MWPWKVPKWPWFSAEVAVNPWRDLATLKIVIVYCILYQRTFSGPFLHLYLCPPPPQPLKGMQNLFFISNKLLSVHIYCNNLCTDRVDRLRGGGGGSCALVLYGKAFHSLQICSMMQFI